MSRRALLALEDGSLFYVQGSQPGASRRPPASDSQPASILMRFDFEEKKASSAIEEVARFAISADGKHLIISKVGVRKKPVKFPGRLEALEGGPVSHF